MRLLDHPSLVASIQPAMESVAWRPLPRQPARPPCSRGGAGRRQRLAAPPLRRVGTLRRPREAEGLQQVSASSEAAAAAGVAAAAAGEAAAEVQQQQQQQGQASGSDAATQAAADAMTERLKRMQPTPAALRVRRERQQLPPVEYNPAAAEAYFKQRPLLVAQRVAQVGSYLMRFAVALVSARVDAAVLGVRPKVGADAPALVLQGLAVKLGPTFVKLAQTLSMRPDLIGEGYAAALGELQDNVPPFDSDTARAIIQEELGAPLEHIFSEITPQPIASASLGQVYRARLAVDGQEVAVKVQRPGVEGTIALDVYLLRETIGVVQRAAGIRRDLRVLADEVGRSLYEEMDFRVEASNAAEFRRAHSHMPFISVPGTMWRYTTRHVLVSEWVDGRSPSQLLSAAQKPAAPGPEGREAWRAARRRVLSLVRMGVQCSLAQLLVTGVMHGDPHSGNLLLRKDDGRLCYLDFGLVVRVTPEHRQAMMSALVHLGLGEWEKLVGDMEALDLLRPGTDKEQLALDLRKEFTAVMADAEAAAAAANISPLSTIDLAAAASGAAPAGLSLTIGAEELEGEPQLQSVLPLLSLTTTALSFGTLTRVLFRIAFRYKFLLPSYFPLVLRAVASLEGVALSVDKNFKLISAGMPVVLNQLLSDRRPAAQALLRELLLNADGTLRSDATTQQILQVWLAAADQAAAAAAGAEVGASSAPAEGEDGSAAPAATTSNLVASLALGDGVGEAAGAAAPGDGGLDLAALLLDGRNAPLRRIAMDANPAKTISGMPPAMRQQLKEILVEALGSSGAASRLTDDSPTGRAQRKRLFLLFRSSLGKVLRSPPGAILALLAFTASVAAAIAQQRLQEMWQRAREGLASLLRPKASSSSGSGGSASSPAAVPA